MINTTVRLESTYQPPKKCKYSTKIIRGASAVLNCDLNVYSYLLDTKEPFKYLEQITFLLKQKRNLYYYNIFDQNKQLNKNCSFDDNIFSYLLSSEETTTFQVADETCPIQFEIVIKLDTDTLISQGVDSTIIEKQLPILVEDSLFSQLQTTKE